jgi:hypothetical protein
VKQKKNIINIWFDQNMIIINFNEIIMFKNCLFKAANFRFGSIAILYLLSILESTNSRLRVGNSQSTPRLCSKPHRLAVVGQERSFAYS